MGEAYNKLDKNNDGTVDLKALTLFSSVQQSEAVRGYLSHQNMSLQEFIDWWESAERAQGGSDRRLATAIAMREAKRK